MFISPSADAEGLFLINKIYRIVGLVGLIVSASVRKLKHTVNSDIPPQDGNPGKKIL
jgi:hypothetical protein